jgi:hypothetical protein
MAISLDGSVGTAGSEEHSIYTVPVLLWTKSTCVIMVSKGKVSRDFAFHHSGSNDIVINDMRNFVDFVDGLEHFTISYLGEKGTRVSLNF